MRNILLFLFSALLVMCIYCTMSIAGPNMFKLQIDNVSTNTSDASSTNVSSGTFEGYIDAIIIDLTGASSPNIDIDIQTTAGGGTGASRTILSVDDVTTDTTYIVRLGAVDTGESTQTNSVGKIPFVRDKIELVALDANKTNINCIAYIIFSSSTP